MALATAPSIMINPLDARIGRDVFSIFDFPGGETERAKPTNLADFTAVINAAIASGERIWFPKFDYPVRTFVNINGSDYGVNIDAAIPIDIECASGARFLATEEAFGRMGSLFRFKAATPPTDYSAPLVPFRFVGGEFSAVDLTAVHGQGTGSGMSLLDLSWYYRPIVQAVRFNGGITAPAGTLVGAGAIDTLLGTHGTAGLRVIDCDFIGGYDSGIYLSGVRDVQTLGNNPFAFVSGSPTVTVTAPANSERVVGTYVWLKYATAAAGLTIVGQYRVQSTPTATTYTITASGNASATTTGGGAAVQMTSELSDRIDWSMAGSNSVIDRNRFSRCSNACNSKRNEKLTTFSNNAIHECGNGFVQADVSDANSYGKAAIVTGNRFTWMQAFPITLIGGRDNVVSDNTITDWGKTLASNGVDFTPVAVGNRIGAINLRSCIGAQVHHNVISQRHPNWVAGVELASKQRVGIQLRGDPDGAWILGSQRCTVDHNDIDGAFYPLLELAEQNTGDNHFDSNRVANAGAASLLNATSYMTHPIAFPLTPALNMTSGSATYDVATGDYWKQGGAIKFSGYIDLATITAPSGTVKIDLGGAPVNAGVGAAPVALTYNTITCTAGFGDIQGQVVAGESAITLYERNLTTGALQLLPAANLSGASRIGFIGQYRAAP